MHFTLDQTGVLFESPSIHIRNLLSVHLLITSKLWKDLERSDGKILLQNEKFETRDEIECFNIFWSGGIELRVVKKCTDNGFLLLLLFLPLDNTSLAAMLLAHFLVTAINQSDCKILEKYCLSSSSYVQDRKCKNFVFLDEQDISQIKEVLIRKFKKFMTHVTLLLFLFHFF